MSPIWHSTIHSQIVNFVEHALRTIYVISTQQLNHYISWQISSVIKTFTASLRSLHQSSSNKPRPLMIADVADRHLLLKCHLYAVIA